VCEELWWWVYLHPAWIWIWESKISWPRCRERSKSNDLSQWKSKSSNNISRGETGRFSVTIHFISETSCFDIGLGLLGKLSGNSEKGGRKLCLWNHRSVTVFRCHLEQFESPECRNMES
jgi:hypothetical protein